MGSSFYPYILYIVDYIDVFRPRFPPLVDNVPYRYSVGAYRGKRRVIIAWFSDERAAVDYCLRCRSDRPYIKFDCLKSMF